MSWIEIEVERHNQTLGVAARGARGERVPARAIATVGLEQLTGLANGVRRAVATGAQLPDHVVEGARELYAAVFRDHLRDLVVRLGEATRAAGRRLLVRLMIRDPELQRIPWEVMCRQGAAREFVGCMPDLLVARGVDSGEPYAAREVRRAVRVLAVSPLGEEERVTALKLALHPAIAEGAIQWLPPILGAEVAGPRLFERLRAADEPHVIHWIGHGSVDERQNPVLHLAPDADGQSGVLLAETLAQELRAGLGAELRLVVLEACSGAKPGAFASAAEILAQGGAEAVVAHLWPVRAEFARDVSSAFYRSLTAAGDAQGDVAASLQATRRTFIERGAEVFSPVLYLRGPDSRVLDLRRRKLVAPGQAAAAPSAGDLDPALANILRAPFSLVLGGDVVDHVGFAQELAEELDKHGIHVSGRLDLSALAQRYSLRQGRGKLGRLFQKAVGAAAEAPIPPVVRALADVLPPGAHTTLLWEPYLEHALAERHPDRRIHVVQPATPGSGEPRLVLVRNPRKTAWEEDDDPPPDLDLTRDFLILRLYGGYSPEAQPVLTTPQLTEDDHIQGLLDLRDLFPPDWECQFVGSLRAHPLLCAGISLLEWRHRMLLRWLLDQRSPSRVSVAVVAPERGEKDLWERGAGGLFGAGSVRAVAMALPDLAAAITEARP